MSEIKIECVCGDCGEPVNVSLMEVRGRKLIMTLDEDHVCRNPPSCADCGVLLDSEFLCRECARMY